MKLKQFWMTFFLLTAVSTSGLWAQTSENEEVEVIKPSSTNPTTLGKADAARAATMIIDRTNKFRQSQGLKPVRSDEELTKAAKSFASYMAKNDRYGHTADGNRPAQRAKKAGYEYCIVLENIAYQYKTSDFATETLGNRFFEGWKESPGHRKNMLNKYVTETGVAIVQSRDSGYYYAVQMFGRPRSQSIEFSLSNASSTTVSYKIDDRKYELPPRYRRTHTVCRPPQVVLMTKEEQTIKPKNGSKYVIEQRPQGGVEIKKQ